MVCNFHQTVEVFYATKTVKNPWEAVSSCKSWARITAARNHKAFGVWATEFWYVCGIGIQLNFVVATLLGKLSDLIYEMSPFKNSWNSEIYWKSTWSIIF